jgi:hypothetical protein
MQGRETIRANRSGSQRRAFSALAQRRGAGWRLQRREQVFGLGGAQSKSSYRRQQRCATRARRRDRGPAAGARLKSNNKGANEQGDRGGSIGTPLPARHPNPPALAPTPTQVRYNVATQTRSSCARFALRRVPLLPAPATVQLPIVRPHERLAAPCTLRTSSAYAGVRCTCPPPRCIVRAALRETRRRPRSTAGSLSQAAHARKAHTAARRRHPRVCGAGSRAWIRRGARGRAAVAPGLPRRCAAGGARQQSSAAHPRSRITPSRRPTRPAHSPDAHDDSHNAHTRTSTNRRTEERTNRAYYLPLVS